MEPQVLTNGTPESSVQFKLFCGLTIFAVAFVGGILPIKLKMNRDYLSFGNVFSGGIFLASGMTHMLKESVESYEAIRVQFPVLGDFPLPYFLCIVGIVGTFFIEKMATPRSSSSDTLLFHHHQHNELELQPEPSSGPPSANRDMSWNVFILALLLSVHSIIEGIALGIETHWDDTTKILVAIVSHKFFAAFAFGINLVKNREEPKRMLQMVGLFSSMTPAGILLGLTTVYINTSALWSVIVQALSAGTFIYIALVEVIIQEFQEDPHKEGPEPNHTRFKFGLLFLGTIGMSLVSAHQH